MAYIASVQTLHCCLSLGGHCQNYNGEEDDNDDKSIHITVPVVMYCTFCDKADVVADVADDDDDYNNAAHNM